ncbi:hypothetical protein Vau01_121450 [Virgisporangium aurantiacum]|uniref:Uncharacterized protein n=1 Tax=Virgisporangium aurantiacum TaxID=175570 RepID=A0A8J4E7S7_9ACTN|nr:hypothetical protein Vau01_121450 [Virgisporangium aurantiacum]
MTIAIARVSFASLGVMRHKVTDQGRRHRLPPGGAALPTEEEQALIRIHITQPQRKSATTSAGRLGV